MKKEEKKVLIDSLAERLTKSEYLYIADISDLNAEKTTDLRRRCFKRNISLLMVKNSLLRKAMEKTEKNYEELYGVLKGTTSLLISDSPNEAAKLIKEFRRTSDKPKLKAAFIQDMAILGDDKIDYLINIKSKNELIADVILSLKSPAINVISALSSGKHILAGLVKTLSEKE
ncbi:MAG: 50S ribosomal protein L10 [Bacteroidales bacterium]|nr:50S ribosomal protein L10 [Bacteroidales bacterium]